MEKGFCCLVFGVGFVNFVWRQGGINVNNWLLFVTQNTYNVAYIYTVFTRHIIHTYF